MIVHPDNLTARNYFGLHQGCTVFAGARYLGGFIGDDKSKRYWLKYLMLKWERKMCMNTEMVGKYPKESYAAVVCEIQPEWIFLQRVTKDTVHAFAGVKCLMLNDIIYT